MNPVSLQPFVKDRSGSVLILVALSLLILVALVGSGYDLGRQQLVRQKIQQACDAAALAAASLPSSASTSDRQNEGVLYFALNFPATYLGVSRPTVNVAASATDVTVSLPAPVNVKTSFISNVGIATLPATGLSNVNLSASASSDYDLVMVVDETGSTASYVSAEDTSIRIDDMKAALTEMANSIVPVGNTNPNVRMGFMGYSSHITNKWGLSNQNADAMQAISNLRPTCNNYDFTGMMGGLNMLLGGQGAPNGQVNEPLIYYFFAGYDCRVDSNTTAPSPRTARTNPSDANGISTVKNVVFLTDGDIMTDPAPCADMFDGRPLGYECYILNPDERNYPEFLASCDAIKAVAGTHIYVVNFASPPAGALAAMQSCASTNATTGLPDFYYAADNASLIDILKNITTVIKKERITQ